MQLLGLWALGGGLALIGALCYAELGAAYGGAGGDYHYLTRAFGPWAGFLFGWTQLVVIQTVNIAMFAHVFAEFAWKLIRPAHSAPSLENPVATATPVELTLLAAGIVVLLTAINLIGIKSGKRTQNLLSAAKLGGLALLIAAGFLAPAEDTPLIEANTGGNWTFALIVILYAYGGWNDAAFVVNDVRDRPRNIPRALLFGVGLITILYLAVNFAYLRLLGFAGLQQAEKPPVALMTAWWSEFGGQAMNVIVMVSALGTLNGLILSVSRLHAAVGSDHRLFSLLGHWSTRHHAPLGSLVAQAIFTVILLVMVGTPAGRETLDQIYQLMIGQPLPWNRFGEKGDEFSLLFAVGAPVFWTFFLATGISFFVLRIREPQIDRPFRTPGFPVTPALFCGMCLFGIWASVRYAGPFTWLGVFPVLVGLAVYGIERLCWGPPASKTAGT